MTDDQHAMLTEYVDTMRGELGLRDWAVEVERRPSDIDTSAQISCYYGQRRALLRVDERWWDGSPETQRSDIVHELVHCHMDPMERVVRSLEGALGSTAYGVTSALHLTAVEFAVDGISRAVETHLPLPSWSAEVGT